MQHYHVMAPEALCARNQDMGKTTNGRYQYCTITRGQNEIISQELSAAKSNSCIFVPFLTLSFQKTESEIFANSADPPCF